MIAIVPDELSARRPHGLVAALVVGPATAESNQERCLRRESNPRHGSLEEPVLPLNYGGTSFSAYVPILQPSTSLLEQGFDRLDRYDHWTNIARLLDWPSSTGIRLDDAQVVGNDSRLKEAVPVDDALLVDMAALLDYLRKHGADSRLRKRNWQLVADGLAFVVANSSAHDSVLRVLPVPSFPGVGHPQCRLVNVVKNLQFAESPVVARMKAPT